MNTTTLEDIKNEFYGKKGTPKRDALEGELEVVRSGIRLRNLRNKKARDLNKHI